jgi:hypothetical protein
VDFLVLVGNLDFLESKETLGSAGSPVLVSAGRQDHLGSAGSPALADHHMGSRCLLADGSPHLGYQELI